MKYDSSMTQFHKDILAAIKHMLKDDAMIKKKFKAEDASPTPLREYLKEQYGKLYQGYYSGSIRCECRPTGIVLEFDTILNNLGDKELTLSWSQVAKFIRDNWDVIFETRCKDEHESDFPCDNCAHDVQGCCNYPDTADDYCAQGDKQVPVNSSADNSPVKFDYSELDTDTAKGLRDCENFIRRKTSGYFTELGQKFKEAQTLLANHSAGTFEKWYTSVGFKRQTVYNLIERYEFLSSPTVGGREEIFEALPLTLSYEISKPDAPAELVDKVLDGDIESSAEYRKLKAELEEANKKAEFFSNARQDVLKENQQLRDDRNNAMTKVTNLERRLKELEKRPVDVAVQQDDKLLEEIERLKSENEQLKNSEPELIDDGTKTFLMRITMADFERLAKLTEKDVLLHDKIIHAQIIRL